jgi:hypothetical protein
MGVPTLPSPVNWILISPSTGCQTLLDKFSSEDDPIVIETKGVDPIIALVKVAKSSIFKSKVSNGLDVVAFADVCPITQSEA